MHKFLLSFLLVLPSAFGAEGVERRAETELGADSSWLKAHSSPPEAAWGIDACLSVHVDPATLPDWVALLRQSDVRWLRERNVFSGNDFDAGIRERLRFLRGEGFDLVAFAGTPSSAGPTRAGDQLPEDLRAVYAAGVRQAREFAGVVSAWELTGEPDVGYCRDLPDRLAAYNKAMYLGLKSGAAAAFRAEGERREARGESEELRAGSLELRAESDATSLSLRSKFKLKNAKAEGSELNLKLPSSTHDGRPPVVLMGALALPPGPWWERAVANGLLDYTDGLNFHFYGHAEDLTSVIDAHRDALRALTGERREARGQSDGTRGRPADRSSYQGVGTRLSPLASGLKQRESLPLWLTECGVNATTAVDFLNPERRAFQAEFTLSTTRQALAARDVAMFMPFILVHKDDPHAMATSRPVSPLPAWETYAALTRGTSWPGRNLSREVTSTETGQPNPVVVQWLPAEGTASHKVSGTYRVGDNEAMAGEFRVYNFGPHATTGELACMPTRSLSEKLKIKAGRLEFFTETGLASKARVNVPAGDFVSVPAIFRPGAAEGYFRGEIEVEFAAGSGEGPMTTESRAVFGAERKPTAKDFTAAPVGLRRLSGNSRLRPFPVNAEGMAAGPWRVFNGLKVASYEPGAGGAECRSIGSRTLRANSQQLQASRRRSVLCREAGQRSARADVCDRGG